MNTTVRGSFLASICLTLLLFASPSLRAQMYVENFTNPAGTSSNTNTGAIGWSSYFATSTQATAITDFSLMTAVAMNGNYACLTNTNGSPTGTGVGFLATVNSSGPAGYYGVVHTFGSALTVANGTQISWIMGNSSTTATVRLLVQSGGNWYASAATFSNTTSNTITSAATFYTTTTAANGYGLNFSTDAANWLSFTLDPANGKMQLGTAIGSNLTSNDITGIGFYTSNNTTVVRLDNLTIIPEPTSFALFGLSIAVLGLNLRQRRIQLK